MLSPKVSHSFFKQLYCSVFPKITIGYSIPKMCMKLHVPLIIFSFHYPIRTYVTRNKHIFIKMNIAAVCQSYLITIFFDIFSNPDCDNKMNHRSCHCHSSFLLINSIDFHLLTHSHVDIRTPLFYLLITLFGYLLSITYVIIYPPKHRVNILSSHHTLYQCSSILIKPLFIIWVIRHIPFNFLPKFFGMVHLP